MAYKILSLGLLVMLLHWAPQSSLSAAASVAMGFYTARAGTPIMRITCNASAAGVTDSVFAINMNITDDMGGLMMISQSYGEQQHKVTSMTLHGVAFLKARGDVRPDFPSSFLEVYLRDPDRPLTQDSQCQFLTIQTGSPPEFPPNTTTYTMKLLTCCVASHCDRHFIGGHSVCKTKASDISDIEIRRQEPGDEKELLLTPTDSSPTGWDLTDNLSQPFLLYKRNRTSTGVSLDIYVPAWQKDSKPVYMCNIRSRTQPLCQAFLDKKPRNIPDKASQNQEDGSSWKTGLITTVVVLVVFGLCAAVIVYIIRRKKRRHQQNVAASDPDSEKPFRLKSERSV